MEALSPSGGMQLRKSAVLNGNNISTIIYNSGAISRPGVTQNVLDFVWNGLGYAYEIGLLVGAEVKDTNGITIHMVSEGFYSPSDGEYGPGDGLKWGWLPVAGYSKNNQPNIATNADPSSWDSSWTQWPGKFQPGKPSASLESFYGMDDLTKKEFAYYPDPKDSTKRGLGVMAEVRCYQFSDSKLADVFFSITDLRNIGRKNLSKAVAGLCFDAHIGGANNYADDAAQFDGKRGMAYFWDADGKSDIPSITPGYFSVMILETPGNSINGIDDDGDGIIDESPNNSIDDDHDWNPATDDVGTDGIPNTHDFGEGNGSPTHGEPNFDEKDRDEVDQLGLTSFSNLQFGGSNRPKNDVVMWDTMKPGNFGADMLFPTTGDGVGVMGSGYFELDTTMSVTLGVAFICAGNYDTLIQRADLVAKEYPLRFSYSIGGNPSAVIGRVSASRFYALDQNYPNPFNPETRIQFSIPKTHQTLLRIYDAIGREVRTLMDRVVETGEYVVHWDGKDNNGAAVASGIYFYRLSSGDFVSTKKMILVR
jgi:hypothetical protein